MVNDGAVMGRVCESLTASLSEDVCARVGQPNGVDDVNVHMICGFERCTSIVYVCKLLIAYASWGLCREQDKERILT